MRLSVIDRCLMHGTHRAAMRGNMELFDAHMHIDLKNEDRLYKHLEGISGGSVIANSLEELEAVLRRREIFRMGKKMRLIVLWDVVKDFEKQAAEWKNLTGVENVGVKLHPRIQNLTSIDIDKIVRELSKIDFDHIVVDAFEVGHRIENHISLLLILELVKAFPDKKIIVAHAGGYRCLEYLLILKDFKNIFYDISFTVNYLKHSSVSLDVRHLLCVRREKILFGTDFPEYGIEETLDSFNRIIQGLEEEEEIRRFVLYENYKNNF